MEEAHAHGEDYGTQYDRQTSLDENIMGMECLKTGSDRQIQCLKCTWIITDSKGRDGEFVSTDRDEEIRSIGCITTRQDEAIQC